MDDRKKILLGNKDILNRKIEDFYIDVDLSRDNKELIPQKYDNIFDVNRFHEQERNECKNFVIYGTLDSYSWDCNNITIKVYQSQNLNFTNYLCQTKSKNIVNNNVPFRNIYNKLRGKYIIDNIPPTFTGCSVYLKFEIQGNLYFTTSQQLVFTTLTLSNVGEKYMEKLPYGLNEAVTTCDGDVIEVSNDFDFFYNKHWIKKDITILDTRTMWVGNPDDFTCIKDQNGYNTGMLHYNTLAEVYVINNSPTGNVTANTVDVFGNYLAPDIENFDSCPLPIPENKLTILMVPQNGGVVTVNPEKPGKIYLPTDSVHISLTANSCFSFLNYTNSSGSVIPHNASDNGINVLMDSSKTITANFINKKPKLQIKFYFTTITEYGDGSPDDYDVSDVLPAGIITNPLSINQVPITYEQDLSFNCQENVHIFVPNKITNQGGGNMYILNDGYPKLNNSLIPTSYDFLISSDMVLEIEFYKIITVSNSEGE